MMSFLSKRKIVAVLIGGCVLLIILLLPFAGSVVYNEIRLKFLEKRTEAYSHLPDSQLLQRVSLVGSFAPASNQCGFIVAEVRTTRLKLDELHTFYAPILTAPSSNSPPYHEVNLFILMDEKGVEDIKWLYPGVHESIGLSVPRKCWFASNKTSSRLTSL